MSIAGLTAALIVKDEERALPACLAALDGVVEAVVVHDTGSTDGTVAIARAAGALVVDGHWDGDFARARNVALAQVRTPWVLVVDADERVVADVTALRPLLGRSPGSAAAQAFLLPIVNHGAYSHPGLRLLRRPVRYRGRVHEQPYAPDGSRLRAAALDPSVLRIEHDGYADPAVLRAKAARNAALAQAQLADLLAAGTAQTDPAVTTTLLDLGRALAGAGRSDEAVEAFATLRALAPAASSAWQQGTDHLARVHLAAGRDADVVPLVEALRAAGGPGPWCDWLAAQALAQVGRFDEARTLAARLDTLVDTGDRRYPLAPVEEFRSLLGKIATSQSC